MTNECVELEPQNMAPNKLEILFEIFLSSLFPFLFKSAAPLATFYYFKEWKYNDLIG